MTQVQSVFLFNLCIYFDCAGPSLLHGLSLVVVHVCTGFSLGCFSWCEAWALGCAEASVVAAPGLQSTGSVVVHRAFVALWHVGSSWTRD